MGEVRKKYRAAIIGVLFDEKYENGFTIKDTTIGSEVFKESEEEE